MAVQFNLIPDIKYQYLKTKRLQRLIVGASGLAVAICIVIVAFMVILVEVKQPHDISNLASDIKTHSNKIKSISGLDTIITIQNQLETLPGLYQKDPKVSRLFNYLVELTPPSVSIGDFNMDLTENTMEIKGTAPSLSRVNVYTDSLKQATYDDKSAGTKDTPAFSSVVLSSFSRGDKGANYTIDMNFDPALFDATRQVKLEVPNTTNIPKVPGFGSKLFQALPEKDGDAGQEGS